MEEQNKRPPVVTILGHVDHGKTTLLDKIRSTHVAAKEAGGITQATSAYQVIYQDRLITFIDTPGHAAFSGMRYRGGTLADVAILVVAADDGVMPQTKESLQFIKDADIPFIVAINKMDAEGANSVKVKTQLSEESVYVEGFGGNVPVVEISGKTGQNIDLLLETLLLLSDLQDLKSNPNDIPTAYVLESEMSPSQGPLATLLIKTGTFRPKDTLFNSRKSSLGKIRTMHDFLGKPLLSASASTPLRVVGLTQVPSVGELLTNTENANLTSVVTSSAGEAKKVTQSSLSIILKSDVVGSLEAISNSLPEGVRVLFSGVGQVSESDVELAKAEHALIVGFNTKTGSIVKKMALVEGVEIVNFKIIYELFDYLKNLQEKVLAAPKINEVGQFKVLKLFEHQNQKIYGGLVTSGKLRLGDLLDDIKIISLRIGRESVSEVKKDIECGVVLEGPVDFKEGDTLKSHSKVK